MGNLKQQNLKMTDAFSFPEVIKVALSNFIDILTAHLDECGLAIFTILDSDKKIVTTSIPLFVPEEKDIGNYKDFQSITMKLMCAGAAATEGVFVAEAWFSIIPVDDNSVDYSKLASYSVKDSPDRQEGLSIIYETATQQRLILYTIVRDTEGEFSHLIKLRDSGNIERSNTEEKVNGRFSNFIYDYDSQHTKKELKNLRTSYKRLRTDLKNFS